MTEVTVYRHDLDRSGAEVSVNGVQGHAMAEQMAFPRWQTLPEPMNTKSMVADCQTSGFDAGLTFSHHRGYGEFSRHPYIQMTGSSPSLDTGISRDKFMSPDPHFWMAKYTRVDCDSSRSGAWP